MQQRVYISKSFLVIAVDRNINFSEVKKQTDLITHDCIVIASLDPKQQGEASVSVSSDSGGNEFAVRAPLIVLASLVTGTNWCAVA